MSERTKAFWHSVWHIFYGNSTYSVYDEWAGMRCDCGACFGTAKEWYQFLTSLDREKP